MKFARITFLIAGLYGIIALLPQYFAERLIGRHFPPPITHPEYFYGFIGVVVVWHLLFLMISNDPARYRPLMLLATAEKFVFGLPTVMLYLQGRVALAILVAALVDLAFGVVFVVAYRATNRLRTASWRTA
ncbi:MAG TPA: hypothetical protein VNA69_18535 [Thermoanaerobaculia bacterium]|nr:hypothetical protein [Thermoanaerobaculia bacterium]